MSKSLTFAQIPSVPSSPKTGEVDELLSRKAFEKLATHQDLSNAIEKVFFRSEFLKKVVLFSKKLFHHPSFASLVYVKNRVSSSNIDLVFWIIVCIKPLFCQKVNYFFHEWIFAMWTLLMRRLLKSTSVKEACMQTFSEKSKWKVVPGFVRPTATGPVWVNLGGHASHSRVEFILRAG